MQAIASEILINSYQVTYQKAGNVYEFILNDKLHVTECVRVDSLCKGLINPIKDSTIALQGMLFEFNHVRVNPKLDNTHIIYRLTKALNQIGVRVTNQPHKDSMAICFKPIGEISENVRFYLNKEGKLIFLSPAMRPRLVYSTSKT
jgi:hypothetical protein